MSVQRPLGPIGHCSARLRRMLAIEEEQALGRTVRVRDHTKAAGADRSQRGGRFQRPADFAVPGAFGSRFVSSDGRSTMHFAISSVSKTAHGGCRITSARGSKQLSPSAPCEHGQYIERPGAVMTIAPQEFDRYAAREDAVEIMDAGIAIRSNISESPQERQRYWRAVHAHERTPGPDRLTLCRTGASAAAWRRLAAKEDVPRSVRDVAAKFAISAGGKTASVRIDALGVSRKAGSQLAKTINDLLAPSVSRREKDRAVRLSVGRGGRSQYRLDAELPESLNASSRLAVMNGFCDDLQGQGFMFVAAIHAPDHHNDRRNHHLHVAFHDRPARMIDGRWDFEITEAVPGQHKRVRHPHEQKKVSDWARSATGAGHREDGRETMAGIRRLFADHCNAELEKSGATRRVDPGSLKDIGCERTPQAPLGTRAAPLEAVGVPTMTGTANAEILWTALLHEAHRDAEDRAAKRRVLLARLKETERCLSQHGIRGQALAVRVGALKERLRAASEVLDADDDELAEYDVTLAMARARPDKVRDTCGRLITAFCEGKGSAAERAARPSIAVRLGAAEAFLTEIAIIDQENDADIAPRRSRAAQAQADVEVITAAAATLLDRDVPALLAGHAAPDHRVVLEALFDRILKDDLPIMSSDTSTAGYRVANISRDELRAVTAPAFANMVQKRLAALAEIQTQRMAAAAQDVARRGVPAIEQAAAAGESAAARTLKHAHAYAAHPSYLTAMQQLSAPPVAPAITSRDEAVAALAKALLAEPDLRVVERQGGLVIDASQAPDWIISADVFDNEPAVRSAMLRRRESPWLDLADVERNRRIEEFTAAFTSARRRPIVRVEGQWQIALDDVDLRRRVEHWRGYDVLEALLERIDRQWSAREDRIAGVPTSLGRSGVLARNIPPRERDRTGTVVESGALDRTIDEGIWLDRQRGAGR